jgi:hypothetical protein
VAHKLGQHTCESRAIPPAAATWLSIANGLTLPGGKLNAEGVTPDVLLVPAPFILLTPSRDLDPKCDGRFDRGGAGLLR